MLKANITGPIFNAIESHTVIKQYDHEVLKVTASRARRLLDQRMSGSFQHPTGAFRSNTETIIKGSDLLIKNDMVYGTWLEGTSSRNETTRFKGYQIFRKTKQDIEHGIEEIAAQVLPAYIKRLQ